MTIAEVELTPIPSSDLPQRTQVDLRIMARAKMVQSWRTPAVRGSVKHSKDYHFCLPGPVDEMALLLARVVWAHHLSVPYE